MAPTSVGAHGWNAPALFAMERAHSFEPQLMEAGITISLQMAKSCFKRHQVKNLLVVLITTKYVNWRLWCPSGLNLWPQS